LFEQTPSFSTFNFGRAVAGRNKAINHHPTRVRGERLVEPQSNSQSGTLQAIWPLNLPGCSAKAGNSIGTSHQAHTQALAAVAARSLLTSLNLAVGWPLVWVDVAGSAAPRF
jgi:hypothetical protein